MMFSGHSHHTLDEKWRLIVPSRYRALLGERFYILRSIESADCFWIMPEKDCEDLFKRIKNSIKKDDIRAKEWFKRIQESAELCEEEKQGRLLVPPHLRNILGTDENKVTLTGMMNRLEVMSTAKWQEKQSFDFSEGCDYVNSKYDFEV